MYAEWISPNAEYVGSWLDEVSGEEEGFDEVFEYEDTLADDDVPDELLWEVERHVENILRDEVAIDAEAWPAIIGAVAAALPSIISGIQRLVGSSRSRRRGRSQPAAQRPARQRPAGGRAPRCPTGCVPAPRGGSARRESDSQATLRQIMTLVTPIVVDLLVPLLRQRGNTRVSPSAGARHGGHEALIATDFD